MPLLTPEQSQKEMLQAVLDELRKGAVQKKHPFHKLVLSTIKGDQAESRWVVFRKLTTENHFLIFTDARSEKVEELRQNPNVTLLFYHPRQGLQVRINGEAQLHHNDELTDTYWPGVKGSPGAKSYQTVQAPGEPISTIHEGNSTKPELNDKHFMLIEVVPHHIEALQLDRVEHIRVRFERASNAWKGTFLVP
jgi:pyridoxine/pyridoxamine 5'-phosphate oxidase